MPQLLKATLQEVSADSNQRTIGTPVPVQFNPTSLKLKLSNQTDSGRGRGRQRTQGGGASSTVLSMDLVFDSADEGSDEAPVSVRTKTAIVEKYVLPKTDGSETPPRLQFQWDELIIAGVVENVDIDFDHFAANGAPLRAKVSLSIKEQDPKYTYADSSSSGAAARTSDNAQPPGGGDNGTTPGGGTNENTNSNNNNDRSDTALEDETAADFLARQGLDPAAWRGLDVDLSAGLSLEAGVEVGFSAGLNVSAGVGVSVGVLAEVGVSLEASLGISASAVFSASASASANINVGASISANGSVVNSSSSNKIKKISGDSAGLALSSVGGVQSAIETVKINETQAVVAQTQAAFGMSSSPSISVSSNNKKTNTISRVSNSNNVDRSAIASANRQPLQKTNNSSITTSTATTSSSIPKADPRSTSYGYGIPLQPLHATTLSQDQIHLCSAQGKNRRNDGGPQFRKQKATAPWVALPQRDKTRKLADEAEAKKRVHPCSYVYHPCGCD